ncbi:SDR family oxidoreductase [Ramlibacter sp. USB13]|uniref:SDR family oxidoreductase n=1 Tax=Ramlibacter cellulosilyticus TaxID=2764187 RepID=A0A923SA52_9BURK|nr:SDR family oxidoreductase [Ramlibacter cellulosilyticus]MBC5782425.1 SDR family oxidoreductase [Ramlibacter cellulosilyticus]
MNVILITGGSDGIGAEMARQLAATHKGQLALVLSGRSQDKLDAVAAQCRAHGSEVLTVAMDMAVEAQCRALVSRTIERFGRLDTLVNNAGISAQANFADVKAEDLHWYLDLMQVNLWGSVWCTHEALPHLKQARGRIVAVSSHAGMIGVPGRTAYSATKFAMTGFFEALRAEMKPTGVSVTIAYPGAVDTRIRYRGYNAEGQPAGRSGLNEDDMMSVEECARLIIDGMDRRQREVVMTAKAKVGRFIKLLAPGIVEDMALKALKEEARPR